MSSVRMCDDCGVVFSENRAGWVTTTAAMPVRQQDGSMRSATVALDKCPECVGKSVVAVQPHMPEPDGEIAQRGRFRELMRGDH